MCVQLDRKQRLHSVSRSYYNIDFNLSYFQGAIKRPHSPSPPPAASPYHNAYGYKPPPSIPNYNPPPPSKCTRACAMSLRYGQQYMQYIFLLVII